MAIALDNPYLNIPTFNVSPTEGDAPLIVNITDLVIDLEGTSDPNSVACGGYSHGSVGIPTPEEVATAGFFVHNAIEDFWWDFGDGQYSLENEPSHTYTETGQFVLSLNYRFEGEVFTIPVLITVNAGGRYGSDDFSSRPEDFEDISIHYGDNNAEGIGWALFDGEEYVWPENGADVLTCFRDEDLLVLSYDRRDGLPYILNPRKDSSVGESFKDKKDFLLPDSGTDISWETKTKWLTGTDEHFSIRPNGICTYIRSLYQDYKENNNDDGLLDGLSIDLLLYRDNQVDPVSILNGITTGAVNMFFPDGVKKEANILQIGHRGNKSRLRLDKIVAQLIAYDKALYTDSKNIKSNVSSPAVVDIPKYLYQNVNYWSTRYNYSIQVGNKLNSQNSFNGGTYDKTSGPDGKYNSAILTTSTLGLYNLDTFAPLLLWSDDTNPFTQPQDAGDTVINYGQHEISGVTWYFMSWDIDSDKENYIKSGVRVFDMRVYLPGVITDEIAQFMFNDVVNNNGNEICPR
jgi:hypothetical protein